MSSPLPPVIAAFIQAQNHHHSTALVACFSAAFVYDDGQQLRGPAAIKQWSDRNNSEYNLAVEVADVARQDDRIVLATIVSGTFDGSPLQFQNHFTISDDKIAALSISV